METADPLSALGAKEIAKRAAGARDLSLMGATTHLELLATVAGSDSSPGVRLTAAAAAADILSRHRLGSARSALDADARTEIATWFRRIDPVHNPGVFSVFACLDSPAGFAAIVGGLRDPRGDVRLGAGVGLMRLCCSGAHAGDADLEAAVVELLNDKRHKPDALAEIARVSAYAGFVSVGPLLDRLTLPGAHGDLVEHARTVLASLDDPLTGMWFSDGRDAGEMNTASPAGAGLVAFGADEVALFTGRTWKSRKRFPGRTGRRMYFRRVGAADAGPAFQTDGRTWYFGGHDDGLYEQVDIVLGDLDWDELVVDALRGVAATVAERFLPETSAGQRALGQLRAAAGDAAGAVSALEASIGLQKVSPDTWFLLAEGLWATGKKKAAKAHYAKFVKKAKKKDFPIQMVRAKSRI